MHSQSVKTIVVGRITGVYGVKGWVKVISYTQPVGNILTYKPWQVWLNGQWQEKRVLHGRLHGKGIVAQISGYDDRDLVKVLVGADVAVYRNQLPALPENTYYWADLEGMEVINSTGERLGIVEYVFATGANDVLVVRGAKKHLIPYLVGSVIIAVEMPNNIIHVDWDADF